MLVSTRILPIICLIVTATVTAGDPVWGTDLTPERVEPQRKRILTPASYRELQTEWKRYTERHPNDAVGWAQLSRVARYAGAPCNDVVTYAERAFRTNPQNAEAAEALGATKWSTYCDGQPEDPITAIRMLEMALALDPSFDDPHLRLWVMRLSLGQRGAAVRELTTLLDRGRIPEPLLDYAHNLLVGLEPAAILLTNGDNDTYPAIALQAARKLRPDVAIVNLNLLNLEWYRRELRTGPAAIPVVELAGRNDASGLAVQKLIDTLAKDGWKRPLYVACTVQLAEHPIGNALSLEGLVYRILPRVEKGIDVDAKRIERNLRQLYRLETATSPSMDWESWSSVRQLMLNYSAAELQLAFAARRANQLDGAREAMERAVALGHFHGSSYTRDLVQQWSLWDPGSPELDRWKTRLGL